MVDIIFNVHTHFSSYPNYLVDIHKDYSFLNCKSCFGKLSKTKEDFWRGKIPTLLQTLLSGKILENSEFLF